MERKIRRNNFVPAEATGKKITMVTLCTRDVFLWVLLTLTSQDTVEGKTKENIFDSGPIRIEDYGRPPTTLTIPLYGECVRYSIIDFSKRSREKKWKNGTKCCTRFNKTSCYM